jgi:hypothetical protein
MSAISTESEGKMKSKAVKVIEHLPSDEALCLPRLVSELSQLNQLLRQFLTDKNNTSLANDDEALASIQSLENLDPEQKFCIKAGAVAMGEAMLGVDPTDLLNSFLCGFNFQQSTRIINKADFQSVFATVVLRNTYANNPIPKLLELPWMPYPNKPESLISLSRDDLHSAMSKLWPKRQVFEKLDIRSQDETGFDITHDCDLDSLTFDNVDIHEMGYFVGNNKIHPIEESCYRFQRHGLRQKRLERQDFFLIGRPVTERLILGRIWYGSPRYKNLQSLLIRQRAKQALSGSPTWI